MQIVAANEDSKQIALYIMREICTNTVMFFHQGKFTCVDKDTKLKTYRTTSFYNGSARVEHEGLSRNINIFVRRRITFEHLEGDE